MGSRQSVCTWRRTATLAAVRNGQRRRTRSSARQGRRGHLAGFLGRAGVLATSLVACANTPPPSAGATPEPGVEASGPPTVSSAEPEDDGPVVRRPGHLDAKTARKEAARILDEVAQARNLAVQKKVRVDVVDKAGIRSFAEKNLYEYTSKEEIELHGRIESSLGALPLGAHAETVLLDMLEDGVLGFYDPKRETLFIGDFVPSFMLSQVVGHEIAHGLQDMHFDLEQHMRPLEHRGDAEQARRFVIEGGAQAAYFAWVSGEDGLASIDDSVLDAMANQVLDHADISSDYPILVRGLQMPYTDGTSTVIRLVLDKGWPAIDELYGDMPQTTEQMLHLDKLLANEGAFEVSLESDKLASALGQTLVWHDEIGEATLLAMLADAEPSIVARKAASGWGGDALLAFDNAGKKAAAPTVIAATVWDTENDAKEFEASFRKYLDAKAGGTFLERQRDVVMFGTQVPKGVDHKSVAAQAWASLSRSKGRTAKRRGAAK